MDEKERTKLSKFLSYVLRHRPDSIGLELDAQGWASLEALLERASVHGQAIAREELLEVVSTNPKRRFALSEDGTRIRASQGHSVPVELGYETLEPPATLFHGTVEKALPTILSEGLKPMSRHHVHLSGDHETAVQVGARRGKPVILRIDAKRMCSDGYAFFRSDNGVWLTAVVPPAYIELHKIE